ncbi:MAG TPA: alkyl hydroperoxide reductase [Gammaproteobacteria bacterium]|nr:alkyl hydroperoxide reductase [Gammaproteobacteria bacterium]|tara:strand:- start:2283 stop:2789 length:507 start_codon:yes stop_codon:yes gene_type:complete
MRRFGRHPFLLMAALAAFGAGAWLWSEGNESAPSLVLADIRGVEHSLEQYRGKVVVVNFWATWCPPCVEELPSLENAWQRYRQQGLVVLAVSGEESDVVTSFLERLPSEITFPVLIDGDMKSGNRWQIRGLPTTVVVDRSGDVHWRAEGQLDFSASDVNKKLLALLDD